MGKRLYGEPGFAIGQRVFFDCMRLKVRSRRMMHGSLYFYQLSTNEWVCEDQIKSAETPLRTNELEVFLAVKACVRKIATAMGGKMPNSPDDARVLFVENASMYGMGELHSSFCSLPLISSLQRWDEFYIEDRSADLDSGCDI